MTLDFKETGRSPVGQYPGTCSGDSVDKQNNCAPVVRTVTCLLLYMRLHMPFLHTVKHFRIVSYRIVSRYFV